MMFLTEVIFFYYLVNNFQVLAFFVYNIIDRGLRSMFLHLRTLKKDVMIFHPKPNTRSFKVRMIFFSNEMNPY
jgi:hypothetical protein